MMLLIPLIFIAFYNSYFKSFPEFSTRIHLYDHIHAVLASVWVLLLIIQPLLIQKGKYALHRKTGRLSYIIFPLLILSFIPREIILFNSDERKFLFFPLADSLVLVPLYILAIKHRKNTAWHMRYMISSALVLLGPILGRIGPGLLGWPGILAQNIQYGIIYLILLSLIFHDGKKFRKSKPYMVAIAFFLIHQIVFYLLFL